MDKLIAAIFALLGLFLTAGLTFAAIRSRQTGRPYLLFWRNPLGLRARTALEKGFFRGPFAEVGRIFFFGIFTLIALAGLLEW